MDARRRWSVHRSLTQLALEGIAEAVLREGKQEDDEAPRLGALVTQLLGTGAVEYTNAVRGDGALVRIHDHWRIYVRRGLPNQRRAFAVAHELAEWWLRVRERYQGEDAEHAANYVAAAILSPRRAFRIAREAFGSDFARLASEFATSETHVALREAELERMPRAVISPALVRVRGPESWVWPDVETIRRWSRRAPSTMRKTKLTDDPRRVVLDVETIDETG